MSGAGGGVSTVLGWALLTGALLCACQCGTSSSRASSTGCGGSAWRSSITPRRRPMRTLCWCSRRAPWLCPPSHTCCAAWLPMPGSTRPLPNHPCPPHPPWPLVFSLCRGIFKLLVKFQLENKDNPSYTGAHMLPTPAQHLFLSETHSFSSLWAGLSFQDFYQRCREAFLVNSDLTLRTQLTEFRDHKLIRTRKVPSCSTGAHSEPWLVSHLCISSPWFSRVRMEWSTWWWLWMQARWWISWRVRRVTERRRLWTWQRSDLNS